MGACVNLALRVLAVAGAAVLLAPVSVVRQELQGRLVGVVTDETKGGPPRCHRDRLERRGPTPFPALPTGEYAVTFSLPGFRTVVRDDLRMTLNTTLSVDATLEWLALRRERVDGRMGRSATAAAPGRPPTD